MMLHIDGSDHQWFQDERRHDLIVIRPADPGMVCLSLNHLIGMYGGMAKHRQFNPARVTANDFQQELAWDAQ